MKNPGHSCPWQEIFYNGPILATERNFILTISHNESMLESVFILMSVNASDSSDKKFEIFFVGTTSDRFMGGLDS